MLYMSKGIWIFFMNSYEFFKYCTRCNKTYDKILLRCPEHNSLLRTRPKGQYGKNHPELIRI